MNTIPRYIRHVDSIDGRQRARVAGPRKLLLDRTGVDADIDASEVDHDLAISITNRIRDEWESINQQDLEDRHFPTFRVLHELSRFFSWCSESGVSCKIGYAVHEV
jgi:hypothetical protein